MTFYVFVILVTVVLDQLTKIWVMDAVAAANAVPLLELREGMSITVLDGVLDFTFITNDGMAFGWLDDNRWVFMVLSVIGICAMLVYLFYLKGEDKLLSLSLALVIGGGIGNMVDRVSLGYVVDFVDVKLFDFWSWIFNVADCAVCVGAALLMISVVLDFKKEKRGK